MITFKIWHVILLDDDVISLMWNNIIWPKKKKTNKQTCTTYTHNKSLRLFFFSRTHTHNTKAKQQPIAFTITYKCHGRCKGSPQSPTQPVITFTDVPRISPTNSAAPWSVFLHQIFLSSLVCDCFYILTMKTNVDTIVLKYCTCISKK